MAALSVGLYGCGGSDDNTVPTAQVRTFNAFVPAPGASSTITVAANGTALAGANGVTFGQFANNGSFVAVPAGTFSPVATGTGLATPLQFSTSPTLNANTSYTLVATGQVGQVGTMAPQLVLVPNPTPSQLTIPAGTAAVRGVNLSTNTNPIGLFNTTGGVPTTTVNAGVNNIPFGFNATTNSFVTVPTTQLSNLAVVDTTNTTSPIPLAATSNLNTTTFLPGHAYTWFTFGSPGSLNNPFSGIWVQEF